MSTAWSAFPMFDRLFDDVMNGVSGATLGTATTRRTYSPAIDVRANADEISIHCDVPGLKHEDLDVSIEAGTLTIRGHRRYEGSESDRVWLGRSYGAFSRSFTLPDHVDAEKMTAELADGVLTIRVPKLAQAKPRRVQVNIVDGRRQLANKDS